MIEPLEERQVQLTGVVVAKDEEWGRVAVRIVAVEGITTPTEMEMMANPIIWLPEALKVESIRQ